MPEYPRLPDPPEISPEDTAVHYGCRLLIFYLETGEYATSTDEQLQAADHAAHFAVTAPGILPAAVDRISAVRHGIAGTLRRRGIIAAEQYQIGAPSCQAPAGDAIGSRDDGPHDPSGRVPRRPYPSAPSSGDRLPAPRVPDIAF